MEVVQLPHMEYEDNPQIKVLIDKSEMPIPKARQIMDAFADYLKQAEEMEKVIDTYVVTDVSQVDLMEKSKNASKALQRIRLDAEITRKNLKAEYLNGGRLVDGLSNVILGLVAPMEAKMNASAKFIEVQEQKRRDELRKKRTELLLPYNPDAAIIPLAEMSEEGFNQMLATAKAGHEKLLADKEAADRKKAEEEERFRKENEALRKLQYRIHTLTNMGARVINDPNKGTLITLWFLTTNEAAQATESELKDMDDAGFKKTVANFQKAKDHNDSVTEKSRQKEADDKAKLEAKMKKERDEKQALQKAENERLEKEAQAKKDEAKAKRKLRNASDKVKAQALLASIQEGHDKVKNEMTTDEGEKIVFDVQNMYSKMIAYVANKIKTLEE